MPKVHMENLKTKHAPQMLDGKSEKLCVGGQSSGVHYVSLV